MICVCSWLCLHWREHHFGPSDRYTFNYSCIRYNVTECECACVCANWITSTAELLFHFTRFIYFHIEFIFLSCFRLSWTHIFYAPHLYALIHYKLQFGFFLLARHVNTILDLAMNLPVARIVSFRDIFLISFNVHTPLGCAWFYSHSPANYSRFWKIIPSAGFFVGYLFILLL